MRDVELHRLLGVMYLGLYTVLGAWIISMLGENER